MKFEGSTLNFTYDASGTPLTMSIDGTVYYYVTNLQGDVVGLLDTTGAQVVTYTYDAWGVGLTVTGTKANSIGMLNPLRYRGYVYDVGTGLYYLQSRYYDPEIGRFINADDIGYLGADGSFAGFNLFAYCSNNPVAGYDPAGTLNWGNILKAAAVVVAVTAVVALTVATAGTIAVAAGVASASVVAAATTGAVVGGLAAGASEIAIQCSTRGSDNLDYVTVGIETFVGSAHGAIDGVASTVASVGGRLACKAGKVALSAAGSTAHSIHRGDSPLDTLQSAGISIASSIALQGVLAGNDFRTGMLNATMLEQNLIDGAMTYGARQCFTTAAIRVISNVFRNRNNLIPMVF